MINVMFVCHGNICRSPMAEFVFKKIVKDNNDEKNFYIDSSATSREEIGNSVYPPAKRVLYAHSIPMTEHRARQFTVEEYEKYDYIIIMDRLNRRNLLRIIGEDYDNKVNTLLYFAGRDDDISDPWYSGDFETTYNDVVEGCTALYKYIKQNG